MNKTGKVALVTGASNGIGQAYAVRLAKDGADIAIADIAPSGATEAMIREAGRRVISRACDVTSPKDVASMAELIEREYGHCEILVNNAGIYPYVSFDEMTFEQWRDVLSVDLDGPFLMCKAIVPMMRRQKYGRIGNVSSAECWLVNSNNLHYIAAKMGVIGLTRALATEVAGDGITVNAICPGITNTATVRRDAKEYLTTLPPMQAIHRYAEPEDMANVMSFMTSDDAAFMTGQLFVNDGGWVRL